MKSRAKSIFLSKQSTTQIMKDKKKIEDKKLESEKMAQRRYN